jgi:arylsulfatase A-like enzyme
MGSLLAGWEIYLSRDLAHHMPRLALQRWVMPALTGTLLGATVSCLLHLLLFRLSRRGRRQLNAGRLVLILTYAAALVLAAGPLRARLFPLRMFSTKPLSIAVFICLAGTLGALLLIRCRRARVPGADAALRNDTSSSWWARAGAIVGILTAFLGVALASIPPAPPDRSRSVIILCLDTLRADRLGVLGNPKPLTPHLDALAREGMVFDQADSTAPWTLPAHASLFSSLLPYDHGARWEHRPLRPSVATLAEHFREAGYRTASFNGGGYVSAYLGLAQGFQLYEEHDENLEGGPERIAAAALRWVRAAGDAPYFLFLHSYEVHSPYTHDEMADPANAGRLGRSFEIKDVAAVQSGALTLTAAERRYVSGLYDSDVEYADRILGGLLDTLRQEGFLDRTILVVLSDHGEDLWDHSDLRSPGHGHSLYQELLHVPLFFRAPGLVAAGRHIQTPVSLLDVAPTLLALAGLPPDPDHQGRSLARTLREGVEPPLVPNAAESIEYGPDRFSLRTGNLKIILTPLPDQVISGIALPARPVEIFDLDADPGEMHDLSASPPPAAARELERLWKRVERVFKPLQDRMERGEIPEQLREQLRSLGYLH